MRSTSFYLDDRISKERLLTLFPIRGSNLSSYYNSNRGCFEAWLICKIDSDHTTGGVRYDLGLEILSRARNIRIVRPISDAWVDVLYYWRSRSPLTKLEKENVNKFIKAVEAMCTANEEFTRRSRGKHCHEKIRVKVMDNMNMLSEYLDMEVLGLKYGNETTTETEQRPAESVQG
jgi:hypothetical protein